MNDDSESLFFRWSSHVGSDDGAFAELDDTLGRRLQRRIGGVSTTRRGGVSADPFRGFNLGMHVGDDVEAVRENRRLLTELAGDDVEFCWLHQVHGVEVAWANEVREAKTPVEADACVSDRPGLACVVMTADCLPVLICDKEATVVAAAHAGWRGLAEGVLEATMEAMDRRASELIVWLGPAIGAQRFEVGQEVFAAFEAEVENAAEHFKPSPFHPDSRWVADLYGLARQRLHSAGVEKIFGGGECTYGDEERFFSYRRDGQTGRMATAIWLRP